MAANEVVLGFFENQAHASPAPGLLNIEATRQGVAVRDVAATDVRRGMANFYLVGMHAAFDRFLDDFRDDWETIFAEKIPREKGVPDLQAALGIARKHRSDLASDGSPEAEVLEYYRLCRNKITHPGNEQADSATMQREFDRRFGAFQDFRIRHTVRRTAPNRFEAIELEDAVMFCVAALAIGHLLCRVANDPERIKATVPVAELSRGKSADQARRKVRRWLQLQYGVDEAQADKLAADVAR